jgi:hypothetical protein
MALFMDRFLQKDVMKRQKGARGKMGPPPREGNSLKTQPYSKIRHF